jgi:hypothetical protein
MINCLCILVALRTMFYLGQFIPDGYIVPVHEGVEVVLYGLTDVSLQQFSKQLSLQTVS